MRRNKSVSKFEFSQFSIKQQQLIYWPDYYKDCNMVIADGSIRSGKTIAMIVGFLYWAFKNFYNKSGAYNFILAGRSAGALKRNVINPMRQILNAWGVEHSYIRSEDPHIQIGNLTFYLFGGSTEASQDTLQGLTAASTLLDEAALMPQSFVEQAIARCSVDGFKIWFNCNPESPYHFLNVEMIQKAAEKKIVHLHFTLNDNLTLSERVKENYRRMFTGVFFDRYILGLWRAAEGIIYSMFSDIENTYDDSTRPPHLESYALRYITIDYGTANPCCFLDIYDDGDTIWIENEYYWDGREKRQPKSDPQYADDLKTFIAHTPEPQRIILDPSALNFKTMLQQRGFIVKSANNDVSAGISAVASLLFRRKIKVHKCCVNFIREVHTYSWDEKKAQQTGKEEPIKVGDHSQDALRYFVYTILPKWRISG
jgi:PBSX family phage terminase large subunit